MSEPFDILIVDDEALARDKLRRFLGEIAPKASVREAVNGLEAVRMIEEKSPSILFLDIQMPGLNGFDVLYHLKDRSFPVVFQTAFDDFAIKAFEENACDYLLKPFSRERFEKAFHRAKEQSLQRTPTLPIQDALPDSGIFLERLCVDERGVKIVVQVSDVDCFLSRDHYTCIHSGKSEYLSHISLQQIEERLDPGQFVRIHRNSVVRLAAIRKLTRGEEPAVTLANGLVLTVSRRNKARLLEVIKS